MGSGVCVGSAVCVGAVVCVGADKAGADSSETSSLPVQAASVAAVNSTANNEQAQRLNAGFVFTLVLLQWLMSEARRQTLPSFDSVVIIGRACFGREGGRLSFEV